MIKHLEDIINKAREGEKKTLSVAVAQDSVVLQSVFDAIEAGIINAILVGDEEEIREIAKSLDIDLELVKIVNVLDKQEAVEKAVELVANGQADFVMKGMIDTANLLKEVLSKDKGLRASKVLSHVMVYDIPSYHKLLLLTDGGMIPTPELNDKVQIINNAVKLAHSLDIECPKVALICSVEVVNEKMQATVDASILTSMNKRGLINDCIVDGPLGFDNAISKKAAEHKGIISEVAGDADVLIVPNIEAGNFLGKSFTYFGGAESAGVIMGAKCPVVLVSRADSAKSKLYSIALGATLV